MHTSQLESFRLNSMWLPPGWGPRCFSFPEILTQVSPSHIGCHANMVSSVSFSSCVRSPSAVEITLDGTTCGFGTATTGTKFSMYLFFLLITWSLLTATNKNNLAHCTAIPAIILTENLQPDGSRCKCQTCSCWILLAILRPSFHPRPECPENLGLSYCPLLFW